jgi:hypothetical protein
MLLSSFRLFKHSRCHVGNVIHFASRRILRIADLQAIEVIIFIFGFSSSCLQLSLNSDSRLDIRKDRCCISSIVNPELLNLTAFDTRPGTQPLKVSLAEDEKEFTLYYGKAPSSPGGGAHDVDVVICTERRASNTLVSEDKAEPIWPVFSALLIQNLNKILGISSMLKDHTSESLPTFVV